MFRAYRRHWDFSERRELQSRRHWLHHPTSSEFSADRFENLRPHTNWGVIWAGGFSSECISSLRDVTWFYLAVPFLSHPSPVRGHISNHFHACAVIAEVCRGVTSCFLILFTDSTSLMECQPMRLMIVLEVNRIECPIFEQRREFRIAASWK